MRDFECGAAKSVAAVAHQAAMPRGDHGGTHEVQQNGTQGAAWEPPSSGRNGFKIRPSLPNHK
jgi:hypothetical protein